MKTQPEDFWNARYATAEYAYGTTPNDFFKDQLDEIKPGYVLLPAEGEGRNALYAGKRGWKVTAFDSSSSGREKALKLASEHGIELDYLVADVLKFQTDKKFDVLALIYAHFPKNIRKEAHQRLLESLNPGGTIIFEAFAKSQLGKPSGGPKNIDVLFSIEEVEEEFPGITFKVLEEKSIQLKEGQFHQGQAEVIRFVGTKD